MKSLSLRSRLLLWSGTASVLTLVTIVVLVDLSFRANIREQLERDLSFAVQVAEDAWQRQMQDHISETVVHAMDTRLRAAVETRDPATARQTLDEVVAHDPTLWAAVVHPTGTVLAATDRAPAATLAQSGSLIREALHYDTGDLWSAGDRLMTVGASALMFGANPLAVLVTGRAIDGEGLSALEDAVARPVGTRIGNRIVLGPQAAQLPPLRKEDLRIETSDETTRPTLILLGAERFLSAPLPLPDLSGEAVATVVLFSSYDEALAPADALRATLIGIFFLGLLLTLCVGALFGRGITTPVDRLLRDTERLARGNLDEPIHPLRSDEIGRLADAFEDMRTSLKEVREDLVRAERLGAIGQAASAVAHDFAQPISTIGSAVGLLRMQRDDADGRERCFDAIEGELDRLKRMKQEIVEFARGESELDAARVRVDGFLENIASGFRVQLAERDISLEVDHGYPSDWYLDSYRMGRVVETLVRNAAAAIGSKGTIVIRSRAADDHLLIVVEDDGPGIPPEILPNLFEPFVTRGRREGTGLGLAITHNVVRQHEGTIDVESSPDGTRFTITLPHRSEPDHHTHASSRRRVAAV